MKHFINSIAYFFRFLLLFLFIGYYSSITMFYHTHKVYDQLFSHSHPYKSDPKNKSPFQSHSHSSGAYTLIQQLNETNWDDATGEILIPEPVVINYHNSDIFFSPFINNKYYTHARLRAPPSIV